MSTHYGIRQHCLQFMHLPREERFEAAKTSMLRLGVFCWSDRELRRWCRESTHAAHEARQEALRDSRARAHGMRAGR